MSGRKTSAKETTVKHGSSITRPLFLGILVFCAWLFFFILTDIYVSSPSGLGSMELRTLGIFRSRFMKADFSSYTFETGMGMSIPRLLLGGFGGLLSIPVSLLPASAHPQALAFLNALRLAVSSAVVSHLISSFHTRNEKTVSSLGGIAYTAVLFALSVLLHFPVADTFFLFPVTLILLRRGSKDGKKEGRKDGKKEGKIPLSLPLILCFCLLFISCAAWDLLVIPALAAVILASRIRNTGSARKTAVSSVFALGICAAFLLPQFLQMPFAIHGEPAASFLQELGNDTDNYHTDVTYHSDATDLLLKNPHSLFIVAPQSTPVPPASESTSIFAFMNDWIYSLWPSLPVMPFQETALGSSDPNTASFTVTTLFSDPLYCAAKLPSRTHPVEVYINDIRVSTISRSQGTVLIDLGSFNVSQTITVKFCSSHAEDLTSASASFGHMNTLNWSQYTSGANFGITSLTEDADGITAEALVYSDSTILTNIPYEKGWSIYINGEKSTVSSYRDAWVSSDLSSGHYIIHLHYTAPGSACGGWISGLTFLILAGLYVFRGHSSSSSDAPETTSSSGASSKSL